MQVRQGLANREAQLQLQAAQAAAAGPQPQGSPDGEVAVTASFGGTGLRSNLSGGPNGSGAGGAGGLAASLKMSGLSAGGNGPLSPVSPGATKNTARNAPVVGECKIAELR